MSRSTRKAIRLDEDGVVTVAGNVPHGDLVAGANGPPVHLDIDLGAARHISQRRLIADDFGDHIRDQRSVAPHFFKLARILVEEIDAAADRIARRVVAADDQQDQIAEQILAPHVRRRWRLRHHGDEVERGRPFAPLLPKPFEVGAALVKLSLDRAPRRLVRTRRT